MILDLPKQWDVNEWFILGAFVLLICVVLALPKKFSGLYVVFLLLFNYFLANTADYILAIPPLNLYDINDSQTFEIFDLLMYLLLYSPVAYIVVCVYDRWKPRGWILLLYLLAWALLTTGLEASALWAHVFTYRGWKLIYSFPTYVAVYGVNLLVYHMLPNHLREASEK